MHKPVETSSKLVAATMEQNQVNRQLAISGQMLEISIPVFNGDPSQYPMWSSSFSALIDCKPMDAQTKLNFLNQYLSGEPKPVVDQCMLIGTEEAYSLLEPCYEKDMATAMWWVGIYKQTRKLA